MRSLRRSALHEAAHVAAFLDGGLGPVEARLGRGGGYTRCTLPDDFSITESEIVGSLCGYYAETFLEPERRQLAARRAADDVASFNAMVAAKHRGHELARHTRRYRARARRLVSRRFWEIYALARELESRGRVGPIRAAWFVWAVGEVRRERANKKKEQSR